MRSGRVWTSRGSLAGLATVWLRAAVLSGVVLDGATASAQPVEATELADPVRVAAETMFADWSASLAAQDANQNGALEPAEWDAIAAESWLRGQQGAFDADGDGHVTTAELRTGWAAQFALSAPDGTPLRRASGYVFNWRTYVHEIDKDRDSRLTREELLPKFTGAPEEREARFVALDTDQDGALTLAELVADGKLWIDAPGRFRKWDTNADGHIDPAEVSAGAATWESAYSAWLFPAFDDDGDGTLTLTEFLATPFANQVLNWSAPRIDANGDGRLGFSEFLPDGQSPFAGLSHFFYDKLDRDDDGSLSLTEFDFQVDITRVPPDVVLAARDKSGDGALTPEELFPAPAPDAVAGPIFVRHRTVFAAADRDGNGAVDAAELQASPPLMKAMLDEESLRKQVRPRFLAKDGNHDGVLDVQELVAGEPEPQHAVLRRDGKLFDWDNSGDLSLGEFASLPAQATVAAKRDAVPDPIAAAAETALALIAAAFGAAADGLPADDFERVFEGQWFEDQFRAFDRDASGTVTRDETEQSVRQAYGLVDAGGLTLREPVGRVFNWKLLRAERDPDGDAIVLYDEFVPKFWNGPEKGAEYFHRVDVDGDRRMTMVEMTSSPVCFEDLVERFRRFDKNLDARLSTAELQAGVAGSEQPHVPTALAVYDRDSDDGLSYIEFVGSPLGNLILPWGLPRSDLNHDGLLDLAEYHPYGDLSFRGISHEFLTRLDRNQDGRLDLGEWEFKVDYARIPPAAALAGVDRDGDGALSRAELFPGADPPTALDPAHDALFARLDRDGNGSISPVERWNPSELAAMQADERRLRTKVQPAFAALDLDRDGRLTLEEWQKNIAADKQPARRQEHLMYDYDRDGALTLLEYAGTPASGSAAERGPVRDPIAEACEQRYAELEPLLTAEGLQDWESQLADRLPAGTTRGFRIWDRNGDGRLLPSELRDGLRLAYGLVSIDGTPLRRRSGQVLHSRNQRHHDKNHDGRIDDAEFNNWFRQGQAPDQARTVFTAADANGDQRLSLRELATTDTAWFDTAGDFRRFDTTLDGRIDDDELRTNAKPYETGMAAAALPQFDLDGDGVLSFVEYRGTPLANPQSDWNARRRDTNNDGRLSLSEYYREGSTGVQGLAEMFFARLDANHDGQLDLGEADFQVDLAEVEPPVAFAALDRDRSGGLTLAEVTLSLGNPPTDRLARRKYDDRVMKLEDAFRGSDRSTDSSVSSEEFTASTSTLALVAAGKSPRTAVTRPATVTAGGQEFEWRWVFLIGVNVLLVGALGWSLLRKTA